MKKLFQIGQSVTPTVPDSGWFSAVTKSKNNDVKFGKVYQVSGYDPLPWQGYYFIYLKGIPGKSFIQDSFAPVVSDTVLSEELSEIFSLEVRK
jgi:hypothetical protein